MIPRPESQVWYLLLHYGVPITSHGVDLVKVHFQKVQQAYKPTGIKVVPVDITFGNLKHKMTRYLFRFPRYRKDDKRALHFVESFTFAFAIVAFPLVEQNQDGYTLRIPRTMIKSDASVCFDDLLALEENRPPDMLTLAFPHGSIGTAAFTTSDRFEAAWRLVPLLMSNPRLSDAVRFWKASNDDFYIFPGEIRDVLAASNSTPTTQADQTRYETALQNSFKAIEAIIGDLPKNDLKFFARIKANGLGPHEKVGYETKEELHAVIRNMNKARDKKAAHGSTRKRTITLGEMFNYHSCAEYVVFHAMETALGKPLY